MPSRSTSQPPLSALSTAAREGLAEIADRVWVRSYAACSTTVVAGQAGLLVVDPAPPAEGDLADRLLSDLRSLGAPVVATVLTHGHAGHASGMPRLREAWPSAITHGHEDAGLTVDRPFSSVAVVDLGDRVVELVHPGRAHSSGDTVLRVPDADVLVAGDLVSGDGVPRYGAECFPLDWSATLDLVIGLLTARTVVVPGHGPLLDKEGVEEQRAGIAMVAQTIADTAAASGTPDVLLASTDWPFPVEHLRHAVTRGLEQLPRTARQLPLITGG